MQTVNLERGDWRVVLAPSLGGALLSCRYKGQNVLRETPLGEDWGKDLGPTDTSCFLLVPFSNRIENGEFSFGGQDIILPANALGQPHPLHGFGWQNRWDVMSTGSQRCVMQYSHLPDAWPWPFRARFETALGEAGLTLRLSVENTGADEMPAGLGFHPYFEALDQAKLQFNSQGVWLAGKDVLPKTWIETPPDWDFSTGKRFKDLVLDNGFTGWDGMAEICWEDRGLTLKIKASENASHAVVYTQGEDNYFCFEPVTHMNNGVNWQNTDFETGVRSLGPNQTLTTQMHISAALV